jgi:hypothetical protein
VDRDVLARLAQQLGAAGGTGAARGVRRVGGQHGVTHYRLQHMSGLAALVKVSAARDGGGFASEASGLRWLADAGAAAVPGVLAVDEDFLAIDWIEPGPPTAPAALCYGQELAATNAAGFEALGAPWPGGYRWVGAAERARAAGGRVGRVVRGGAAAAVRPAGQGPRGADRGRGGAGRGGRRARSAGGRAGRAARADPLPASHAPFMLVGSWPATSRRRRWPRAGGPGCRCTSCIRCWCTAACSAGVTPDRR